MKLFDFFKKKKGNQPLEETSTSTVENNLLEIEVKLPEQQNETPEKVEKKTRVARAKCSHSSLFLSKKYENCSFCF